MNTRKVGTLLLTGMIVGISLTSCKKDEVDPEQTTSEKLVGNWESSYEEDGYTYTTNLDLKGNKDFSFSNGYCYADVCYTYEGLDGTWEASETKLILEAEEGGDNEDVLLDIITLTSSSLVLVSDGDTLSFTK